jgi:hypothetical protein
MTDVLVSLDMFPALVQLPHGGTIEPARVIVSNLGLLVLIGGTGGPQEYFVRDRVISLSGSRLAGYQIQIDDGMVVSYQAPGCGCGTSLRGFDPFPGMNRVQVPA